MKKIEKARRQKSLVFLMGGVPEAPCIGRSFNLCSCKAVLRAKTKLVLNEAGWLTY